MIKAIAYAFVLVGLSASISTGFASEKKLQGQEITAVLTGNSIHYDSGAIQYFNPNGRTDYSSTAGPSEGGWEVRDDQYCSEWGTTIWVCYDVTSDQKERITFISDKGVTFPGKLVEGFGY